MHEIVKRYPVDGLHLDYIRFPNEWNSSYPKGAKVPDYPRDGRTLSLFRKATGQTPESAPGTCGDKEIYVDFRPVNPPDFGGSLPF